MPLNDTSRKWQLKRDQLSSLPNFKKRQISLLRPRVSSLKSYEHDSLAKIDEWLQAETGYSATWEKNPTQSNQIKHCVLPDVAGQMLRNSWPH